MNKESKFLALLIILTVFIVAGSIVENYQLAITPMHTEVKTSMNVDKVRDKILEAGLKPRAHTHTLVHDTVNRLWLGLTLQRHLAQWFIVKEILDQIPCFLRNTDLPGRCRLLDTGGEVCGVPNGCIVHPEIISNRTYNHQSGIDANPHLELYIVVVFDFFTISL